LGAGVEPLRSIQLRGILDPPAEGDEMRWLEYGRLLWRLHTELAADGLDFAVVATRGQELENFPEQARWSILHDLQQSYLRLLDRLELWDIQTARLVAVQRRECRTDCDLIMVGTVDMTILLRQMLDQVADRVTALVFAPESWSDRFDEHGCLIPSAWERVVIAVRDDGVHVVEGPPEQADRAARCLADFGGRYRADQITIGLADEKLRRWSNVSFSNAGIRSRYAAGVAMSSTSPWRLVAAVQAFLQSGLRGLRGPGAASGRGRVPPAARRPSVVAGGSGRVLHPASATSHGASLADRRQRPIGRPRPTRTSSGV
jgi:ATP-dependent helicase/nuclease subunit B